MAHRTIAFLFPGQGSQTIGMGKEFAENFATARRAFEEADDLLQRSLSRMIFEGPEELLSVTANSQVALYTVGEAALRVIGEIAPHLKPSYVAGLSLGEYTALRAGGYFSFSDGVKLVEARGNCMSDACEANPGAMAVILGLKSALVEELIADLSMPEELWIANFNCQEQVVISGTLKGITSGTAMALARGAKRVLPLNVQGAFHSGLMQSAALCLASAIREVAWQESSLPICLNVTGTLTTDLSLIAESLVRHITSPVLWERGIHTLVESGVDLFLEIGNGTTLTALNKRMGIALPTYPFRTLSDLPQLAKLDQG